MFAINLIFISFFIVLLFIAIIKLFIINNLKFEFN
jgi:hypothetical protein